MTRPSVPATAMKSSLPSSMFRFMMAVRSCESLSAAACAKSSCTAIRLAQSSSVSRQSSSVCCTFAASPPMPSSVSFTSARSNIVTVK